MIWNQRLADITIGQLVATVVIFVLICFAVGFVSALVMLRQQKRADEREHQRRLAQFKSQLPKSRLPTRN